MTKQEYQAMLADIIEKFPSEETPHPSKVMCEYIESLEAEIAQVKKDKLELNAQCFHKDETISVLKKRITELEFDNRSLVR